MPVQTRSKSKHRGLLIRVKNVQLTKSGVYRYRRIVPIDLRTKVGKTAIIKSLGTKCQHEAMRLAIPIDKKWDAEFARLRSDPNGAVDQLRLNDLARQRVAALGPISRELRGVAPDVLVQRYGFEDLNHWEATAERDTEFDIMSRAVALAQGHKIKLKLTIRDALNIYFENRPNLGTNNREKFETDRKRFVERLIEHLGDNRDVMDVSHGEARSYMLKTAAKYAPDTTNKEMHIHKAIFEDAYRLLEVQRRNPWDGLTVEDDVADRDKRDPFPLDVARGVLALVPTMNTDLARIAMVAALTGARVGEISGLEAGDFDGSSSVPSLTIHPNSNRSVKTKASRRTVAPVGPALDALYAAKAEHATGPLFPRYANGAKGANQASAAIMKFLRSKAKIADEKLVWHSWRHTVKDLMRNAGIEEDLQRCILGHARLGVASSYGKGYELTAMRDALAKALTPLIG